MPTILLRGVDVKSWLESTPSLTAMRPARCPGCGVCGALEDGVRLHGHGLRERLLVGPLAIGGEPGEHSIMLRRYRCRECGTVVQVGPSDLLPKRRYGLVAIVLALVAWGVEGRSSWDVREAVSPQKIFGHGTRGRWPMLRRWAPEFSREAELPAGSGDGLRGAAALVRWWAAHTPVSEATASLSHRALCGARLVIAHDH